MSENYNILPRRYAESLLYVDLVDIMSAYRKFSKLVFLSQVLGIREASLSKYANGRIRPRTERCLSLVKVLTDSNLVKKAVAEYLKNESLVDLLTDVHFTKLIALSVLEKIINVFHGSRVEAILTSSEAILVASHLSHRLKSSLLNLHTVRGSARIKNLGNCAAVLVMVDEEIVRELSRVKTEGRRTNIRYIFSIVHTRELALLSSIFPNAVVDYLIKTPI
ncbi:MAG: hypothetical protein RMI56_05855 [Sulfolobales archaeon]|nr:hypothetical protein [Sulfolobales archaeon]MDW8083300.1 hypothetical protein [Sulfolobales archaeon]